MYCWVLVMGRDIIVILVVIGSRVLDVFDVFSSFDMVILGVISRGSFLVWW